MREITNCGAIILKVSLLSPLMSYADEAYFAAHSRIKELRRPSMTNKLCCCGLGLNQMIHCHCLAKHHLDSPLPPTASHLILNR